jgi:hypothetical protein
VLVQLLGCVRVTSPFKRERGRVRDDSKLVEVSTLTPHLSPLPLRRGRGDRKRAG